MTRQKRSEARSTQVLDAAAECFVQDGFHNASMSKLAERANMSVGHIYHYFENKDAVIKALVEREIRDADERTSEIVTYDGERFFESSREKLQEAIARKADPFHSVLNMEIIAESQRNPEIAKILRDFDELMITRFTAFFRDRLKLDNPEARVEMLFLIFQGLPIRLIRNPDINEEDIMPMIERTIRFVLDMPPESPDGQNS